MTTSKQAVILTICLTLAGCAPNQRATAYEDNELYQGYPCTPSCDDFKTGYDLAEREKYVTLSQCLEGVSPQAIGCKAYVTEYQLEQRESDQIRDQLQTP